MTPGDLRGDHRRILAALVGRLAGDIPGQGAILAQVVVIAQAHTRALGGNHASRAAYAAGRKRLPVPGAKGVGEGNGMAGLDREAKDRAFGEQRAQGHRWKVWLVATVESGRVHPSQQGHVAGAALGQPIHTKGGINGAQQQIRPLLYMVKRQWAMKQIAEGHHCRSGQGIFDRTGS